MSALYKRNSGDVAKSKNQQNFNISVGFEKANTVALALMKAGYTLESVCIENTTPLITLVHCPKCNDLQGFIYAQSSRAREGHCRYYAIVDGCRIEWKSTVTTH